MRASSPRAMQRAASLVQLPALLADLGATLDDVLGGTGVTADDLRADNYIPFAAYLAILDRAAAATGCDDIGLRLGKRLTLAALGPVGEAMRCAATLGEALSDFATFQISNSSGGAVYLHRTGDVYAIGYGVYEPGPHISPHLHDVILGVGSNIIRELTRGAVQPLEIHSVRATPADLRPYRQLADCPIRFGQGQTCMFLSEAAMAAPLPLANRAAHDERLADLTLLLEKTPWGMAGRVKHSLRSLMLVGRTGMPDMARHLEMHPRSLRRALAKEGTSFEAIKQEVRHAAARELLALTPLAIGDISMTLDFASQSSFVHSFRSWSGVTPTRWRSLSGRS